MQTIATEFNQDGFSFKLLERSNGIALFQKSKPHHSKPCYEVVRLKIRPEQDIYGRHYPEREGLPTSESWGTDGWSYSDEKSAKKRFENLEAF